MIRFSFIVLFVILFLIVSLPIQFVEFKGDRFFSVALRKESAEKGTRTPTP